MGFTVLPSGVDRQTYRSWLQSDEGKEYNRGLQTQARQGLSVSHAPPEDKLKNFQSRQQSAGLDMSSYAPGSASPKTQSQGTQYGAPRQPLADALPPPGYTYGPNGRIVPEPRQPRRQPAQRAETQPESHVQHRVQKSPAPKQSPAAIPMQRYASSSGPFSMPASFSPSAQITASYTPPTAMLSEVPRPSFSASYTNFDGSTSAEPGYSFRDAFIDRINNHMLQYQTGQATGVPEFDIQSLISEARDMASSGFQNPFSFQSLLGGLAQ